MRPTIVWLIPAFAAIVRVLQCVSPFGVVSSVLTITASTSSSEIVRGAPTRGSSYSPSSRRSMNRVRHLPTVALVVRYRRATARVRGVVGARQHQPRAKRERTDSRARASSSAPTRSARLGARPTASWDVRSLPCPIRSQCGYFFQIIRFQGTSCTKTPAYLATQ